MSSTWALTDHPRRVQVNWVRRARRAPLGPCYQHGTKHDPRRQIIFLHNWTFVLAPCQHHVNLASLYAEIWPHYRQLDHSPVPQPTIFTSWLPTNLIWPHPAQPKHRHRNANYDEISLQSSVPFSQWPTSVLSWGPRALRAGQWILRVLSPSHSSRKPPDFWGFILLSGYIHY